jgi:hypothetical protein
MSLADERRGEQSRAEQSRAQQITQIRFSDGVCWRLRKASTSR